VGREDLIEEPWFRDHAGRVEHADELDAIIQDWANGLNASGLEGNLAWYSASAGRELMSPRHSSSRTFSIIRRIIAVRLMRAVDGLGRQAGRHGSDVWTGPFRELRQGLSAAWPKKTGPRTTRDPV